MQLSRRAVQLISDRQKPKKVHSRHSSRNIVTRVLTGFGDMAGKRGSSSSVKGKKSVDSKNEPKTRKSLRNSSGSQQQALEALDVETDESGSEQGDAGEEEIIAYHRNEGKGEGDHEDEEISVPIRAAKKPPVFKSNSFFKLNNNLMLSGKINRRNLLSSSAGQKGNKSNNKKSAMVSNQRKANPIEEAQRNSAIYDPNINAAPPLIPAKSKREKTLGKGWFDMKPATLDGSMKGDIKMVEMMEYTFRFLPMIILKIIMK